MTRYLTDLLEKETKESGSFWFDVKNELGCTYQTWGYCLKEYDNDLAGAATNFNQAEKYFTMVEDATKNSDTQILRRIDNLLDYGELLGYKADIKTGKEKLTIAKELMSNYHLSREPANDEYSQIEYYLNWAKYHYQQAERERWKFQEDLPIENKENIEDEVNTNYLRRFAAQMLWAFAYLLKFQNGLLKDNSDYIRDAGILEVFEEKLNLSFVRTAQRLLLIKFLKKEWFLYLFPNEKDSKVDPNLRKGRTNQENAIISPPEIPGQNLKPLNDIILIENLPYLEEGFRFIDTILDLGLWS